MGEMMVVVVILVATAVLALVASALRGPPAAHPVRAVIAFLAGLGLTAGAIKGAAHMAQLYPEAELAHFAARVVESEDARPTILFLGTSMSAYEIDDVLLTERLHDLGFDVRAVSMSMAGASQQERDLHLRQYLRATDNPPDVLMVEISFPTDAHSWYVFNIGKFSERAIKQFGPRGLYWSVRAYFGDGRPEGLYEHGRIAALFGIHATLNALNIGFLRDARPLSSLEPEPSYEPQTIVDPEAPTHEEIVEGLSSDAAPEIDTPRWATAFRQVQADYARGAGVREVGYYMPPTVQPGRRSYFDVACAVHVGAACISGNDPALLEQLDPELWRDDRHLLEPGAQIYTLWLVEQLVGSGLLERMTDQASAAHESGGAQ